MRLFDLTQEVQTLRQASLAAATTAASVSAHLRCGPRSAVCSSGAHAQSARVTELERALQQKEQENKELISYCEMLMARVSGGAGSA